MTRVAISVEGLTEEAFVKRLLVGYLEEKGIFVQPFPLHGNITVQRLASDMAELFWDYDFVTSLVDFYGFRDKGEKTIEELEENISEVIDKRINRSWDQRRIFPTSSSMSLKDSFSRMSRVLGPYRRLMKNA